MATDYIRYLLCGIPRWRKNDGNDVPTKVWWCVERESQTTFIWTIEVVDLVMMRISLQLFFDKL